MKFSKYYILIAAVLLLAFITNPGKEKHVEKASEVISEYLSSEGEADLFTVAMGSLVGAVVGYKMDIDNFLFFTTSSIRSSKKDDTLLCGVGVFGQVIWVASENNIEEFTSDHEDKKLLKNSNTELKQPADIEEIDPALQPLFK
ncbi:hypothetical protein RM545_09600 [Zunongwangia sp. F260]|uniref:Uncharacterized protein n=1 Tax=Autumnicola lenta TaxID=3075593 RepID=A0ABU3CLX2_9FLAO|nr:hypothetical protein [Zunongwangia sp. F260]MDT0646945.1 hypothetical protein [Zunongwangia sp. F260]